VKTWIDLYREHRAARSASGKEWSTHLRKRLIELAKAGHCDATIQGRFTRQKNGDLEEWFIRGKDADGSKPEPLKGLSGIETATLDVLLLSDPRTGHIHKLTIAAQGKRKDGSTWVIAVHLPDDRIKDRPDGDRHGSGACGHPALHCHVGPDLKTVPKVRVPLPALDPPSVLDWVLSQITGYEPALWSEVNKHL